MQSDLEKKANCNISKETQDWNRDCLKYVDKRPYQGYSCNVSKKTLEWNRACLDYVWGKNK